LQGAKQHCHGNSENDGRKHQFLTHPHFFRPILTENHRNDDSGKNHYPHHQKYKYALTELLASHTFYAEIQLWGQVSVSHLNLPQKTIGKVWGNFQLLQPCFAVLE